MQACFGCKPHNWVKPLETPDLTGVEAERDFLFPLPMVKSGTSGISILYTCAGKKGSEKEKKKVLLLGKKLLILPNFIRELMISRSVCLYIFNRYELKV